MDRDEIVSRLRREPGRRLDDLSWGIARPAWTRRWHPPLAQIAAAPVASHPLGFLTAENAQELGQADPEGAAAIVDAAERIVDGRFQFFGYPEVRLERPLDFSRDPFSGRSWPSRYGPRIDYRHSDVGDPKWIWELNRCQHIPLLVEAWLLSGDSRFAEVAASDLADWIAQQPVGRGIAWANGFEPALRAISFAAAYDALRSSDVLSGAGREAVLLSLWQHARWILREPSRHSSANNHRIGELVGLAVIALLVPELERSAELEHTALRELDQEAERQILPDGTSVEQAFGYQVFVIDLLLVAAAALRSRSRALPEGLEGALARSADALAALLADDEPVPTYGDTDDSRALRLDGTELRAARGVAAGLAALLGHAGARRVARGLDAAAHWLFGSDGARRFAETVPAASPGSCFFPDGGLVVLRAAGRRVLFDVGPLGFGSLAAHGHADALQVTLTDETSELIVYPGVGSFFGDPEWRDAFRGTAFHPTVLVDGLDQSESGGPFLWRRHAVAHALEIDPGAGFAAGAHDGYLRLADPVRHVRAVVALPDGPVLVVDRLEARAHHAFVQSWPLHPLLDAEAAADSVVHATLEQTPRLALSFAASERGRIRLVRGRESPPSGWSSRRLQDRVPAWHCHWEVEADGEAVLAALLWPVHGADWPDPDLSLSVSGSSVSVSFDVAGDRRNVEVSFTPRVRAVTAHEQRAEPVR